MTTATGRPGPDDPASVRGTRPSAAGGFAAVLSAYLTATLSLFVAFVLVDQAGDEPNIGAGALLLPLVLISLPGRLLAEDSGVPYDAAVLVGVVVNGLVVALLLARRQSRRASGRRSRSIGRSALAVAALALLGTTALLAVASGQSREALDRELGGIAPLGPWTEVSIRPGTADCVFCAPRSGFARSVLTDGRVPDEQQLLALVDVRMSRQDFRADGAWDCGDLDSGDLADRSCSRGYVAQDANAFVRVYSYERDRDPQLWVDITRTPDRPRP